MPVNALRSVSDHFDAILRGVRPKRLALEMKVADKAFYFKHFKGYRADKIGRGRLKKIAQREIFGPGDGHDLFANLIIVHWNEAERELYRDMVRHVQAINEDVEAIERIEVADAHRIIDDLLERYTADRVLVCVRLNGVRFDEAVVESRLVKGEPAPDPGELAAHPEAADADGGAAAADGDEEAAEVAEVAGACDDAPEGEPAQG